MKSALLILVLLLVAGVAVLYKQGNMDSIDYNAGGSVPDGTGTSTPSLSLADWAKATYVAEGNAATDLATRNNNPGNLKFAGQPGAAEGPRGFAVFSNFTDGFNALVRQLNLDLTRNPNWTLLQWRQKYLGQDPNAPPVPSGEGDPVKSASTIADQLGVSMYDTLGNLFGGNA